MPTQSNVGPSTALSGVLGKISYSSQCPIFPFPPYLALQESQLPWGNLCRVWPSSWADVFSPLPLMSPTLVGAVEDAPRDLGTLTGVWGQREAGEAQLLRKLFCFHQEREGGSCCSWFAFRGEERNRLCSPEVVLWSLRVKGSTFRARKQDTFCIF